MRARPAALPSQYTSLKAVQSEKAEAPTVETVDGSGVFKQPRAQRARASFDRHLSWDFADPEIGVFSQIDKRLIGNILKPGCPHKRVFRHRGDPIAEGDGGQLGTAHKGAVADSLQRFTAENDGKRGTAGKGAVADRGDRGGDHQKLQRRTAGKCKLVDLFHSVAEDQIRKSGTAGKGAFADGGDGIRKDDRLQLHTGRERIRADGGDAVFDRDALDAGPPGSWRSGVIRHFSVPGNSETAVFQGPGAGSRHAGRFSKHDDRKLMRIAAVAAVGEGAGRQKRKKCQDRQQKRNHFYAS